MYYRTYGPAPEPPIIGDCDIRRLQNCPRDKFDDEVKQISDKQLFAALAYFIQLQAAGYHVTRRLNAIQKERTHRGKQK